MTDPVAIIGAGIAGATAARRLTTHGVPAVLFEKSRGAGGRMSTRRVTHETLGDLAFDHGAQYLTVRGAALKAQMAAWIQEGVAATWFRKDDGEAAYVGTPGMTHPAKVLIEAVPFKTGCQVSGLSVAADGLWTVHDADGPITMSKNGRFAQVVLAMPPIQAQALAATAGIVFDAMDDVTVDPCWAVMLAYDHRLALPFERYARPGHDALAWVADQAAKPGRRNDLTALVVHATSGWSERHLEETPEAVLALIREALGGELGITAEPAYATAHRWRYAQVRQAAGQPCLFDEAAGIGACGDWCIGPRVEAAYNSGLAMADRLLEVRGISPSGA